MTRFVILDYCLSLMNEIGEDYHVSVTIFAGGNIISGDLIHPAAYFRSEAKKLESLVVGGSTIASDYMEELIKELPKESNVPDQIKTENQDVEGDIIYLTNIKPIHPSNRANFDGAFMAFRIDAIDGFVFGGMT